MRIGVDRVTGPRIVCSEFMRVDAVTHAGALADLEPAPRRIVIIDTVRASSTIAHAVCSGAKRIIPAASISEAWDLRQRFGVEKPLLGGEREGLKIEGFDLGNSPQSYTPAVVRGRTLIVTTTNGTRAMRAADRIGRVVVAALVNLPAVVAHLLHWGDNVLLAPVGREGAAVLDDLVCAGMYADALGTAELDLSETAQELRERYLGYEGSLLDALRDSASGQALIDVGLGGDLDYCAKVGVLNSVPVIEGGVISESGTA